MIVYRSTKSGFREDLDTGNIDGIIQEAFPETAPVDVCKGTGIMVELPALHVGCDLRYRDT